MIYKENFLITLNQLKETLNLSLEEIEDFEITWGSFPNEFVVITEQSNFYIDFIVTKKSCTVHVLPKGMGDNMVYLLDIANIFDFWEMIRDIYIFSTLFEKISLN